VIAATNRDLWAMVKQGKFREDLYFRVPGWAINLPSLRERGEDILTIAQAVLKRRGFADYSLSQDAKELLRRYSWPGNVRELESAVAAAAIRSSGRIIGAGEIIPGLAEASRLPRSTFAPVLVEKPSRAAALRLRADVTVGPFDQNSHLEMALRILTRDGRITQSTFRAECGKSSAQTARLLGRLVARGALVAREQRRWRFYEAAGTPFRGVLAADRS
jgi:transcriptional regulator with GAF, ATPase, and Fis domain